MKIAMTGGGTSGHVTPNIALFPLLKDRGFEIIYLGTKKGIECELISEERIPFFEIEAGKLRRYIDFQNIKDISKIFKGYFQALKILKKEKPDVVFSKGGFVSCPVVWAAAMLKIPVVLHESDFTPGLANKLSAPFATKICYSFPETAEYLPSEKSILTGIPVRYELLSGDKSKGCSICNFKTNKPVLTIMGGSQGSAFLNDVVRMNLDKLLEVYNVCHLCGKGKVDESLKNVEGYSQFEYVSGELKNIFAATDVFVSRAGATAIFELLAMNKPMLLIPLSRRASRGDQILNAQSFEKSGFAEYIQEEELTPDVFYDKIIRMYNNRETYKHIYSKTDVSDNANKIVDVINSVLKERR